jgi:hypothetical protein
MLGRPDRLSGEAATAARWYVRRNNISATFLNETAWLSVPEMVATEFVTCPCQISQFM